jgi:ribonuclease HI
MIKILKKILLITSLLWLIPIGAAADIIYLKDGTKVKAAKVWEEKDVIRFSLEDFENIIITYSKEIVDRIEKSKGEVVRPSTPQRDKATAIQKDVEAGQTGKQEDKAAEPQKSQKVENLSSRSSKQPEAVQQPKNEPAKGVMQPPPKRAPQTTGTKIDKPAKTARAKTKVESPANTITPKVPSAGVPYGQMDGILFYNPRRPYKYWTGPNAKHHTLKEALAALAKQFERDPQWVAEHLGKTNNLGDIYRNLNPGGGIAPSKVKPVAAPKGFLFYDPRRPYKFWTGAASKHRTLGEALDALARQYDRPSEWVKAHMGESNDLSEIHRNLMQSNAKGARE